MPAGRFSNVCYRKSAERDGSPLRATPTREKSRLKLIGMGYGLLKSAISANRLDPERNRLDVPVIEAVFACVRAACNLADAAVSAVPDSSNPMALRPSDRRFAEAFT